MVRKKTWEGVALVIDTTSNGTWKVSFFWPVKLSATWAGTGEIKAAPK
jgi:hypothetical protein